MLVDQEYQDKIVVPPYIASNSVGFHKEYPKQLYKQVFEPELTMKPNYKAIKLFDPQELVKHLQKHFPLVRKNVQQFDDQMKKLSLTFGNLILNGFHIDDFLKKFFLVVDKRLHKFFDHLDHKVLKQDGNQIQEQIPGDYRLGDIRQQIRQRLIDMSQELYERFGAKRTPMEFDREVIKKIDQILRVYEQLKYDQGWNFVISITKFNLEDLLERVCNNELTQFNRLDDLIENMFLISMKPIKDATIREPTFNANKDISLAKFHSIINDRSDPQMSTDDLFYISKTVCMRDRRIIYNEFYSQINQQLKEIAPEYFQFSTTGKSDYQKEREELHKNLLKIQKDWEALKMDENYYLVLEDRINEEDLRTVPLTSEQQLHQLQRLNTFANKASNLQYDAVDLLKKILDHKDKSKEQVESKLQEALDKAKQHYANMAPGRKPQANQIKQHVDALYNELQQLLHSDPSKYQTQTTQLEKSVEGSLSKNKQNPYLQKVQKDIERDKLAKEQYYKRQENEARLQAEYAAAQSDLMIQQKNIRDLQSESVSTRPYSNVTYSGKILEGSSQINEAHYERNYGEYQRPTTEPKGKYESEINKQKDNKQSSLNRDVYMASNKGYYVDDIIGVPKNPEDYRKEIAKQQQRPDVPKPVSQPKQPEPQKKPEPPKEQPKKPEPPKEKKPEPPKEQPKKPEPPKEKKPEPPKEQPKKPEPPKEQPKPVPPKEQPKKPEPPKEQPKQPEPPKKPEPPKEQPKPEPPKKPDPPKEQPKQPEPPKKPEPPKEQPKPDPPKKPEPPKEQPKQPEPPKKPEPPKEPPKQPEPPKKPEPPKEPPKQPEPPKKPEPPKEPPKQPEVPKKPEPPKEPPKQPEPPKKPEPPKEPPKQPDPPKKPEQPKEPPKQPEPPRKPEPPKEPPKQPDPPKKPEPPKEPPKQPEPPRKPDPPKEQPKPEPPKQPDPPKEQPKPEPPRKPEPVVEPPRKPEPQSKPANFRDPYAIDLDDDEQFGEEDEDDFTSAYVPNRGIPPQQPPKQPQQVPAQKPPGPGDFGFSDEEEKEIDKIGGEEGDEPFEQLPLITKETLALVSKYVKSTKYGKSTPVMTEELSNHDVIIQMFEEFILQDEAYFLDFDETQILLLIYEKAAADEECNPEIEECMKSIELKFQERTQKQGFGEAMKMYFPFEDNPFEFYLLEKDPIQKILILYYDTPPNEAVTGEEFETFIQIFQQLFQCEDFEISQVVLTPATSKKLKSLKGDNKYLKYLLTLFTILYEQQQQIPDIEVTDDTVARAYWALMSCTDIYGVLQENEEELRAYFMDILQKAQQTDKANSVTQIEDYFSQEGIANIQDQIQMVYEEFLKHKQVKQYFFSVDIVVPQQQMKYTYYVHLSKVAQLNFLKVFMMQHYAEMNEQVLPLFLTEDGLFTQKVYIDYARHNFLYEYGDASLGAWYHLVVKKNYKPEEAMGIMAFSLAPYNIILSKQE